MLVLLQSEGVARAQSDEERAAARSAAQQGVAAWKEGRFSEAVDMLKRAESVVHAPTHLLYMARSYEKLGKLVSAREAYLKLTKEQLAANAPKAFRDAKGDGAKELALLEPRLGHVKIMIEGARQEATRVLVDDVPVPATLVGIPQPTDPGLHKYQAIADGAQSQVANAKVDEGTKQTVTLILRPAPAARGVPNGEPPSAAQPPTKIQQEGQDDNASAASSTRSSSAAPDAPPPSSGVSSLRVVSYIGIAVGVLALGTGGYFWYLRSTRETQSNALFLSCNPRVCSDEEMSVIQGIDSRANAAQRSSNISFVLGGVSLAAGLTMLIVDVSSKPSTSGSVRVRPWIGANTFGMSGEF